MANKTLFVVCMFAMVLQIYGEYNRRDIIKHIEYRLEDTTIFTTEHISLVSNGTFDRDNEVVVTPIILQFSGVHSDRYLRKIGNVARDLNITKIDITHVIATDEGSVAIPECRIELMSGHDEESVGWYNLLKDLFDSLICESPVAVSRQVQVNHLLALLRQIKKTNECIEEKVQKNQNDIQLLERLMAPLEKM